MINTPIYHGLAQSDLDMAGFDLLNWSGGGGGGGGAPARKFDVKTYGAIGNGTTDDTTAIQTALAAIPSTGGVLYFPAGQYKYTGTTLTLNRQITVEGDGGGVQYVFSGGTVSHNGALAITTIDFNSATVPLFTVTANGCGFKNLGLRNTSGTTPSAGAGILVSSGGDRTRYENISVDGFYIDIDVQAGSGQVYDGCWIVAPVLYGLKLRNVLQPDGGDHFVSNCYFCTGGGHSPTSAIRIESGGGVKIIDTKFNGMSADPWWVNGIDLAVGTGVATFDLLICNCSIEAYTGTGIKGTTSAGTSTWHEIVITGNQISPSVGGAQYAINLNATTAGDFDGITITGNWCLGIPSSNPAISLTNCLNVVMSGNGQSGYSKLIAAATTTFQPVYVGTDFRLVSITGGAKIQVRNPGTDTWVDADQWTNP